MRLLASGQRIPADEPEARRDIRGSLFILARQQAGFHEIAVNFSVAGPLDDGLIPRSLKELECLGRFFLVLRFFVIFGFKSIMKDFSKVVQPMPFALLIRTRFVAHVAFARETIQRIKKRLIDLVVFQSLFDLSRNRREGTYRRDPQVTQHHTKPDDCHFHTTNL